MAVVAAGTAAVAVLHLAQALKGSWWGHWLARVEAPLLLALVGVLVQALLLVPVLAAVVRETQLLQMHVHMASVASWSLPQGRAVGAGEGGGEGARAARGEIQSGEAAAAYWHDAPPPVSM